ncbi:MAG: hypothetical protein CO189_01150 [candidate division Zixibacteria bacterium CG_4_9_14_3_um_filter_46_8]|nr:MAG: hypothetical protein CO189_01150 [candidate division Zixibacteria bacterium CG_4_9_14_3_um_filter_46_8]
MIQNRFKGFRYFPIFIGALLALLLNNDCGFYTFSGAGLKGIKTVAVPLFDNQTTEYGLREDLAVAVTNALVADHTLKVINIRRADSALRGVLTKYERECYTFDGSGNCSEYIVRLYVDITFEDLKNKKVVWEEKNVEGFGIYAASEGSDLLGKQRAVEKLSADIIDKVIKGW